MQELKFEDNNITFFSLPFLPVSHLLSFPRSPKFWDYRRVALQSDYSSPVTSSLSFIPTLWVNGRLGHWSERKAEASSFRHVQWVWNWEHASESPFPTAAKFKPKGGGVKGQKILSLVGESWKKDGRGWCCRCSSSQNSGEATPASRMHRGCLAS